MTLPSLSHNFLRYADVIKNQTFWRLWYRRVDKIGEFGCNNARDSMMQRIGDEIKLNFDLELVKV